MKAFLAVARVIVWIIEAICLIAMVSLVFSFFLLLFGANPTAWFTQFVYSVAKPFMAPFKSVFPGQLFVWPDVRIGYVNLGIIVALAFYAIVSSLVSWVYVRLSGSYYRRQAQDSLSRDVAVISAASAAAATSQAQAATQAAQAETQAAQAQASAAQAAAQAQAAPAQPVEAVPYPPAAEPRVQPGYIPSEQQPVPPDNQA